MGLILWEHLTYLMSFNIQFGIMLITSLIIVVPILITRGLRGILKIISILNYS